jgi:hypothetical protein
LSENAKKNIKVNKNFALKFLDKKEKFAYSCIYVIKNSNMIVNSATIKTSIIPSKLNKKPKIEYDITSKIKYKNLKRIDDVINK